MNNTVEEIATPKWQLCPKCLGDGHLGRHNSPNLSTTTHPLCDVCSGAKILATPNYLQLQFQFLQAQKEIEVLKTENENFRYAFNRADDIYQHHAEGQIKQLQKQVEYYKALAEDCKGVLMSIREDLPKEGLGKIFVEKQITAIEKALNQTP